MIKKEFIGLDKNKALRKALDFWYKNFREEISLKNFISYCSCRIQGIDTIITYRGPAPGVKNGHKSRTYN